MTDFFEEFLQPQSNPEQLTIPYNNIRFKQLVDVIKREKQYSIHKPKLKDVIPFEGDLAGYLRTMINDEWLVQLTIVLNDIEPHKFNRYIDKLLIPDYEIKNKVVA